MWPASNVATGAQRDARRTVNQGSAPGFDWLGETPSNGRKRRKRTPAENVARSFLGDFGCYGLLKLKFWQCRSALFSCRLSGTKQGHVVAYPSASHSRFLLLRSFAVLYVLYCACLGLLTIVGLEREKGSFFFYEYNVGHTKQPIILILC